MQAETCWLPQPHLPDDYLLIQYSDTVPTAGLMALTPEDYRLEYTEAHATPRIPTAK
jgi:hypothetical protein